MSKKSESGWKLLLGAALVGAAAYGAYKLLESGRREQEKGGNDVCRGTSQETDEVADGGKAQGIRETEERSETDVPCEEAHDEEKETHYTPVELKQAADRAYTTIRHGSQETMNRLRTAVGPKGEEVIATVGEAAEEMGRTVAASAVRIRDILTEEPVGMREDTGEEPLPEEDASVGAPETEPDACAGESADAGLETSPAAVEHYFSESEEEGTGKIPRKPEEDEEASPDRPEDDVEEYFDDEDPQR